ncbi:MAG TPA: nickel-responsive transcriptional regulator NikR [Polyangiaceae bacterium]|jgi:CopG family nickel-responsive transcriptional regulator
MKESLVRFGVAMEASLIEHLDALAELRGCNRSELLRDLTRAEVSRVALEDRVPAYAAVTLVYNHHVRELSERLTSIQHDLGEQVRSTMHVHLDHEHCMELIVMRGRSDQLKQTTLRLIGTRGVIQGGAEYVSEKTLGLSGTGRRTVHSAGQERAHARAHGHDHSHGPDPDPDHDAPSTPPRTKRSRAPARAKSKKRRS